MKAIKLMWGLILFSLGVSAQVLPIEKVFLTSDRLDYNEGDSILLEGKVMTGDTLSTPYGRYLYVELFNGKDSLISRQKLVSETNGDFISKMQVDYGLKKGIYYLRAYTKLMQNFPNDTYPIVPIRIGLKNEPLIREKSNDLYCKFFPEGGHLGLEETQNVAVYLYDQNRKPVCESYVIVNQQGDTIQKQKTTPGGWQTFSITPRVGMSYYLKARYNEENFSFLLPQGEQKPLIQAFINKNRLIYKILSQDSHVDNGKVYLYNSNVGLLKLPFTNGKTGMVNLEGIRDGIVTLFLADNDGNIISQNAQWYHTKSVKDTMLQWKTSYNANENLVFPEGLLKDDSESSLWVRILPENQALQIPQAETELLLDNEFTSDVPVPVRYVSFNTKDRETDWRGWLYSAQLKRFDVAALIKNGFNYKHKPEAGMMLTGEIQYKSGNYPLENGTVVAMNTLNGATYVAELDEKGHFVLPIDDFHEKSTFFVQGRDKKDVEDEYNYTFNSDTFPGISNHKRVLLDQELMAEFGTTLGTFDFEGNNLMPEVIVKGRIQQEKHESTEKFYGTRYIGKEALARRNYQSFEHMLSYFHNFIRTMRDDDPDKGGMSVRRSGPPEDLGHEKAFAPLLIFTRRASTVTKKPLPVLVDGERWTAEEANQLLNMRDVDYVELLTPQKALAVVAGAIDGALIVRTKRWEKEIVNSKGVHYTPPFGIANLDIERDYEKVYKAPNEPGKYNLFVDVINKDKSIQSYMTLIEVKK